MVSKLSLTRDQLASFLKNHEQIKQFERLFSVASELEPTTLADLAIDVGVAAQQATQALDSLNRLSQQLDELLAHPKDTEAIDAVSRVSDRIDELLAQPNNTESLDSLNRLSRRLDELLAQPIGTESIDSLNRLSRRLDELLAQPRDIEALDSVSRVLDRIDDVLAQPPAEKNNSVATDYIDHNISAPVPADKPGRVYWSDDNATLDLMLIGGVTYQFGQQLDFHPKNTSGVQIDKGMAVMATGVVGSSTKITCARAVADGTVAAQYMIGIATQDIPHNDFGYVAWFGSVRGFNTTGANKTVPEVWVNGDILYFDPAYPGELTNVQPAAPNLDLPIAIITNVGNNGSIFVRMKTGETMNELHDVHAPSPASGNVLIYDAVQTRWESNGLTAGAGITITNAPGAVTIASVSNALPLRTQVETPSATGFSVTVTSVVSTVTYDVWLLLKPTSGFAAGTIVFPAVGTCVDQQVITVTCTQQVNALAINGNGATVQGAPAVLAADSTFKVRFNAVSSTWYVAK